MRKRRRGHYKRGSHVSSKTGTESKFRSGWEESFMIYLDNKPSVKDWSYETITIDYLSNKRTGKIRKYYPDFFVEHSDGTKELVEIKPKKRLNQLAVQKKISAAIAWCESNGHTFKILTEIELKEMGVI